MGTPFVDLSVKVGNVVNEITNNIVHSIPNNDTLIDQEIIHKIDYKYKELEEELFNITQANIELQKQIDNLKILIKGKITIKMETGNNFIFPEGELITYLESEGYNNFNYFLNHGLCGIMRMMYTTGLFIGLDKTGYSGRYCYDSIKEAINAINEWNGEGDPSGDWIKYKGRGGERSNSNLLKEL